MFPVNLAGKFVVLREFREDDAAALVEVYGDDAVTRWLSFDSRDPAAVTELVNGTVQRARSAPRIEYHLAVTVPDDTFIGSVRLGLNGVKAAKLGYAIRADQWGKGYATDAARTITAFGFAELGLHRISAAIGPDNAASITVASRLGMRYEGRLRDHVFTNGAWRDSNLYSVLAHEWHHEPA